MTRAERSAITRARIIQGAIACLIDFGYQGTSTTAITERAGVSRGAYQHHFKTKQELVLAAIEELTSRLLRSLRQSEARLPAADDPGRVPGAVDAIWTAFSNSDGIALAEVWLAARTDVALTASTVYLVKRLDEEVTYLCDALFGARVCEHPDYDAFRTATLSLLRGMMIERTLHVPGIEQRHDAARALWARGFQRQMVDPAPAGRVAP